MDAVGLAPSTKNVTLASISWLVSALHQLGKITWTLKVRGFKAMKYRDTTGPDEQSVRAMLCVLRQARTFPLKAVRDEALVRLAVSMGLRRSEIVQLDLEDVDCDGDGGSTRLAVLGKGCDQKQCFASHRGQHARCAHGWSGEQRSTAHQDVPSMLPESSVSASPCSCVARMRRGARTAASA